MSHFSDDNIPRTELFDWSTEHRDELTGSGPPRRVPCGAVAVARGVRPPRRHWLARTTKPHTRRRAAACSAAGQCLKHEHLVRLADRIAEPIPVGDAVAVDIDRHVPPYTILVIKDVRPQPRLHGEHAVEHGTHQSPGTVCTGQLKCRSRFAVNATRATRTAPLTSPA